MKLILEILLLIPIILFILPGRENWREEIPKLIFWYLIIGIPYIVFYL